MSGSGKETQGKGAPKEALKAQEGQQDEEALKRRRDQERRAALEEIRLKILEWFDWQDQEKGDPAEGEAIETSVAETTATLFQRATPPEDTSLVGLENEIKSLAANDGTSAQEEERVEEIEQVYEEVSQVVAEAALERSEDEPPIDLVDKLPEKARAREVLRKVETGKEEESRREVSKGEAILREAVGGDVALAARIMETEAQLRETEVKIEEAVSELAEQLGLPEERVRQIQTEVDELLRDPSEMREWRELLDQLTLAGGGGLGGEPIGSIRRGEDLVPRRIELAALQLAKLREIREMLADRVGRGRLTKAAEVLEEEESQVEERLIHALAEARELREERTRQDEEAKVYSQEIEAELGSQAGRYAKFEDVYRQYTILLQEEEELRREVARQREERPNGQAEQRTYQESQRKTSQRKSFEKNVLGVWTDLAQEKLADRVADLDQQVDVSGLDDLAERLDQATASGDTQRARLIGDQILTEVGRLRGTVQVPELASGEEVFEGYFEYHLAQRLSRYTEQVARSWALEVPDGLDEQMTLLQDRIAALMRLGEAPEVLYYSPLWTELTRWLADSRIKPEVLDQFKAVMDVSMRFGGTIGESFDTAVDNSGLLASWKVATLLGDNPRLAEAYDLLEDSATGRFRGKSGLGRLDKEAASPEGDAALTDDLKHEWVLRRLGQERFADEGILQDPQRLATLRTAAERRLRQRRADITERAVRDEVVRSLGRERLRSLGKRRREEMLDEADSFLKQATPLWVHMSLGRFSPNSKEHWGVQRLNNYYERLYGTGIGDPTTVDKLVGRKFVEVENPETGHFEDYGHKLGLAVQNYYEYVAADAIKTLGVEDFQEKTGFTFATGRGGRREVRRVRLAGREIQSQESGGRTVRGCFVMRREDGMEILVATKWNEEKGIQEATAVVAVYNPTAEGIATLHREAKDITARKYLLSYLRDADGARKSLEESNFWENPIAASLGAFTGASEPAKQAQELKQRVGAHLPEIETNRRKHEIAEQRKKDNDPDYQPTEWQRDPGVLYKEDYFRQLCLGLGELVDSREGRRRYEAYGLAPWHSKAVILTAFGRANLITPEMEEELERQIFGPKFLFFRPRNILPLVDLSMVPLRLSTTRTMLVFQTVGNFFKTMWAFVTSE